MCSLTFFVFASSFDLQVVHVLLHARAHVGIGDRRHGALVFLHLGHDLRRERHGNPRQLLLGDLLDALLVPVVREGVDQRDGERLDLLLAERAQVLAQLRLVEWRHDLALRAHALVRLDRQRERRHRQRLVVDHPAAEAARHEAARNLQHLPVARRRHEADARAGAGQHGIRGDRRAVHDVLDLFRRHAGLLADAVDAAQHADRLIRGCARNLGLPGLAGLLVHEQQVGEGSAYVHAQTVCHEITPGCRLHAQSSKYSTSGSSPQCAGSTAPAHAACTAGFGKPPALTSMPGTGRPSCSCSHLPVSMARSSEIPVS